MRTARVVLVLLFFIAVGVVGVCSPPKVWAEDAPLWGSGAAVATKNIPLIGGGDTTCQTYRQEREISEYAGLRSVCLYGDERLRIGTFFEGNYSKAAVGFAYSNKMNVLEGVCGFTCRYSVETDTLVTQQTISQGNLGLVVYKRVSDRVQPIALPLGEVGYVFNATHPDYEIKNDIGQYVLTPKFNLSQNGRWLVAELPGKGTVVIDLATFTARQITNQGQKYGYGRDPVEELAVSDDGRSVAVMGENVGFYVFDVDATCGQPLIGNLEFLPGSRICPSSDIGMRSMFPNFFAAGQPRFIGKGHQLEVVVTSYVEGARLVTFVMGGAPMAHQLKLLSLGDSFSSGEGETDDKYYLPGTNAGFDTCHVSSRAYSGVVARLLGMHDNEAKNIACSGATTGDFVGSATQYWGQGNRLGASRLNLTTSARDVAKQDALTNFQPGRTFQTDFIERYNPEIITIGIGGNDAGLMGKLHTCAMPGTCEWAQDSFRRGTGDEIQRLQATLGSVFKHVSDIASDAKVFVVGYPSIIQPDGVCDLTTGYLLDDIERVYIQKSLHYLNQVIRAATEKAGFHYVDVERSFDGKQLCSGASSLAMNGLRMGDDIAIISKLPMLKVIGIETFHPTPLGHSLVANTLLSQYPQLQSQISLVVGESVDPEPDSYWNNGEADKRLGLYHVTFAKSSHDFVHQMELEVTEGTLQPGSNVTIEIHSEPIRLASLVVDEDGAVHGAFTLPDSIADGYHTLHLLGTNRTGETIDLYQFLTIGEVEGAPLSTAIKTSGGESLLGLGASGVLGAEVAAQVSSLLRKYPASIASYVECGKDVFEGVGLIVVIVVGAGIVTIAVIIARRKWMKPSS